MGATDTRCITSATESNCSYNSDLVHPHRGTLRDYVRKTDALNRITDQLNFANTLRGPLLLPLQQTCVIAV